MEKINSAPTSLTVEQEQWIKQWLCKWGNWTRTSGDNWRTLNSIGRMMNSLTATPTPDPICTDEQGVIISQLINGFLATADKELQFIIYGYYVHKKTVNRLSTILLGEVKPRLMQPCSGKSELRKPSKRTLLRYINKRLDYANSILYDLLRNAPDLTGKITKNQETSPKQQNHY